MMCNGTGGSENSGADDATDDKKGGVKKGKVALKRRYQRILDLSRHIPIVSWLNGYQKN